MNTCGAGSCYKLARQRPRKRRIVGTMQRRSPRLVLKISQNFLWLYAGGKTLLRAGGARASGRQIEDDHRPRHHRLQTCCSSQQDEPEGTRRCCENWAAVKRHPQRQIRQACRPRGGACPDHGPLGVAEPCFGASGRTPRRHGRWACRTRRSIIVGKTQLRDVGLLSREIAPTCRCH